MTQNIFKIDVTVPEKVKTAWRLYALVEQEVKKKEPNVKFSYLFSVKYELESKFDEKKEDFNEMKNLLRTFVNFTN